MRARYFIAAVATGLAAAAPAAAWEPFGGCCIGHHTQTVRMAAPAVSNGVFASSVGVPVTGQGLFLTSRSVPVTGQGLFVTGQSLPAFSNGLFTSGQGLTVTGQGLVPLSLSSGLTSGAFGLSDGTATADAQGVLSVLSLLQQGCRIINGGGGWGGGTTLNADTIASKVDAKFAARLKSLQTDNKPVRDALAQLLMKALSDAAPADKPAIQKLIDNLNKATGSSSSTGETMFDGVSANLAPSPEMLRRKAEFRDALARLDATTDSPAVVAARAELNRALAGPSPNATARAGR